MRIASKCTVFTLILLISGANNYIYSDRRVERGLSCSLFTSESMVPMGAQVEFILRLRFDPTQPDATARFLDRYARAWSCSLHFVDMATGSEFIRTPYNHGMLIIPWQEDIIELKQTVAETLLVYLLSEEGTQIPPGHYSVTAAYQNDSLQGFSKPRPSRFFGRKPPLTPKSGELWLGRVESSLLELTVSPATDDTLDLQMNSAIKIYHSKNGIGWSWSEENPRTIRLTHRPGYTIGSSYKCRVVSRSGEVPAGGGESGRVFYSESGRSFLGRKDREFALSNVDAKLIIDLEVFETSVPVCHGWMPEHGDFKILWEDQLSAAIH